MSFRKKHPRRSLKQGRGVVHFSSLVRYQTRQERDKERWLDQEAEREARFDPYEYDEEDKDWDWEDEE